MSYTPTTWETGDTITAEKLNNMEQGIAGASVFKVTFTWDSDDTTFVPDKTYAETLAAFNAGSLVLMDSIFSGASEPGSGSYDGYGETGWVVANLKNGVIYWSTIVFLYNADEERNKIQKTGWEWSAEELTWTGYEFYLYDY